MDESESKEFPVILISGKPYDLGYQHGIQAKEAIGKNIEFYFELWKDFCGIDKSCVLKDAEEYLPYIERLDSELLEEMRGVSEGAQVSFEEILSLNCRWELNYAYMPSAPEGCTSFVLTHNITNNGHILIGQNWDYRLNTTSIILRIKREKKNDIIMNTEAGIIGHKGFNSSGIGICINFIQCEKDVHKTGYPVMLKIRKILDCQSLPDCLKIVMNFKQPNSSNLVIAHKDGEAIDLECTPYDTFFIFPEKDIITHANHFESLSFKFKGKDTGKIYAPDTEIRSQRLYHLFEEKRNDLSLDTIKSILTDHFGYPDSICRHRDERLPAYDRVETLSSMIVDLTEGRMHYTSGPPCSSIFHTISIG